MELQRPVQEALPSLQEHDPTQLVLPAVPSHDIAMKERVQLPCIRAVLSPEFDEVLKGHSRNNSGVTSLGSPTPTPFLPRIEPPSDLFMSQLERSRTQSSSTTTSSRRVSEHERGRPKSIISIDDPDVRIAAEALSGLGNPGMLSRCIATKRD